MIVKKKNYVFFIRMKWFNNYKKSLYLLLRFNNKLKDKKVRRVDFKIFAKQYP